MSFFGSGSFSMAGLEFFDSYSLRALGAPFFVEAHSLAFFEGFETNAFNGAVVHKEFLAAVCRDETITFLVVKPLHLA